MTPDAFSPLTIMKMPPKFAAILLAVSAHAIDLKTAVIVAPSSLSAPELKAAVLLSDEIEHRTRIRLPIATRWPASGPAIFLGQESHLRAIAPFVRDRAGRRSRGLPHPDRGNTILVLGNDARGTLFGAGALLRRLHMDRDTLEAPDTLPAWPVPPSTRCAATNSAIGPRPIPTTAGASPCGSSTSATWPSSAPTPSS